MATTNNCSRVTVVLGDLTGWRARLVYRSTDLVPLTISADSRFAQVGIGGQRHTAAVVTPAGASEPVLYLGPDLPDQPLSAETGWAPVDMPAGVTTEALLVEVLAFCRNGSQARGLQRVVWLPRLFRAMERLDLPVADPLEPAVTVGCRVLESHRGQVFQDGIQMPYMVVAVEDADLLVAHDWQEQSWIDVRAHTWRALDGLSMHLHAVAQNCLGAALIDEVIVYDLPGLDIDALPLLPRDVRDGLERALLAMPD